MKLNCLKLVLAASAVILTVISCCSCAYADAVFSTASGALGSVSKIDGDFAVTLKAAQLGSSARLFDYNDGARLLVVEDRQSQNDHIRIYDPENLSTSLADLAWENVRGIRDATYLRGYLYVICHDSANVVKINTNDFTKKEIEWIYPKRGNVPPLADGSSARGVGITLFGDEIYALFRIEDASGISTESVLVNLADDITTLRTLGYVALPPGALDLAVHGDRIYAATGGIGADSSIQRIDPVAMTAETALRAADLAYSGETLLSFSFSDAGQTLLATSSGGTQKRFWLVENLDPTTAKNVLTVDREHIDFGYDRVIGLFWITSFSDTGGASLRVLMHERLEVLLDTSVLGEEVRYVAPIKKLANSDGGGTTIINNYNGSSGCSGMPWPLLLALSPLLLTFWRPKTPHHK